MAYGNWTSDWVSSRDIALAKKRLEEEIQDSILNAEKLFENKLKVFNKEKGKKMSDTVDKIIMLLVEEKLLSEDIKLTEYITLKAKIVKILEED